MALTNLSQITSSGISTLADVSLNSITGVDATFTGNVSIGGTLTYDDVTNIDSVGLITARSGVRVLTGTATTALVVEGNARVTGILTVGSSSLTLDGTNNVVNVGTALTLGHTQGLQFHTQNLHSQGFDVNNVNATGIVTAGVVNVNGSVRLDGRNGSNRGFKLDLAGSGDYIIQESTTDDIVKFGGTGSSNFFTHNISSGNLGIGTDNPAQKLHVFGNTGTNIQIEQTSGNIYLGSSGNTRFGLSSGANLIQSTSVDFAIGSFDGNSLIFGTNNFERLRIDAAGRLLLGTTHEGSSSADDLTVATSAETGITIRSGTSNPGNIFFSDGTSGDSEYRGFITYAHADDSLRFATANTERLRIKSDGDVFIGNISNQNDNGAASNYRTITLADTSNGAQLHLRGQSPKLFMDVTGGGTAEIYYDTGDFTISSGEPGNAGGTERLRITSDGKVGIGLTNPGQALSISGNSVSLGIYNTGTTHGNVYFYKDGVAKGWLKYRGNDDKLVIGNVTDAINVLTDGKVGIGINNPSAKLDIYRSGSGAAVRFGKETIFGELQVDGQRIGIQGKRSSDNAVSGFFVENPTNNGTSNFELVTIKTAGTERLRIDSLGKILIGPGAIANPKVTTIGAIDTSNSDWAIVMGGSGSGNRANAANKDGRFAGAHYTNAEEPIGLVRSYSTSSANEVHFGGGSSIINAATQLSFYTAANTTTTGGTERLRIKSNGNIGIGDNDPADALTVHKSNVGNSTGITIRNTEASSTYSHARLRLESQNGAAYGHIWADVANSSLRLAYNSSSSVNIKSNGDVGIGIGSPDAKLHVEENLSHSSSYYLNADAHILVDNPGSGKAVIKLEGEAAIVYGGGSNNLIFADRQNERMRIDSSGNLRVAGSIQSLAGDTSISNLQSGRARIQRFQRGSNSTVKFSGTSGYIGDMLSHAGPTMGAVFYMGSLNSSSSSNASSNLLNMYYSGHWGQYTCVRIWMLNHYYNHGYKVWEIRHSGSPDVIIDKGATGQVTTTNTLVGSGTHGGQNVNRVNITCTNPGTYFDTRWYAGIYFGSANGVFSNNKTVSQMDAHLDSLGSGVHFLSLNDAALSSAPMYATF